MTQKTKEEVTKEVETLTVLLENLLSDADRVQLKVKAYNNLYNSMIEDCDSIRMKIDNLKGVCYYQVLPDKSHKLISGQVDSNGENIKEEGK